MTATDLDLDALLDALQARALQRAAAVELVNVAGDPVGPGLRAATGRLQVNPGDLVASVWGNTTYDQTVEVFDNPAARDAQWPAPKDGAVSYTTDAAALWVRQAGTWQPVSSPGRPPVSSGGLVTAVDLAGTVWVAKPGVNAGAWRRAVDVLHGRWYRTAAFTLPTTVSKLAMDTASRDPYGMLANGAAVTPVAGLYLVHASMSVTATSAGILTAALYQNGVLKTNENHYNNFTGNAFWDITVTDTFACAAADIIELWTRAVATFTGGPSPSETFLTVDYLGTG